MDPRSREVVIVAIAALVLTVGFLTVGTGDRSPDLDPLAPPIDDTTTTLALATTSTTPVTATSTSTPTTTTTTPTTTSTTPTTTTPTTTSTTPTTILTEHGATFPLEVSQSNTVVGPGGIVSFEGSCPSGHAGPVVVDITSDDTERVGVGFATLTWTYDWTAPTAPDEIGTHVFRFWCGSPLASQVTYPAALERRVDMVDQLSATTTAPAVTPTRTLPATG